MKVIEKANESIGRASSRRQAFSKVVWQSEQLPLTQQGLVLASAVRARRDASAWMPVVSQRRRAVPEREFQVSCVIRVAQQRPDSHSYSQNHLLHPAVNVSQWF